jgi:hypothetical protein
MKAWLGGEASTALRPRSLWRAGMRPALAFAYKIKCMLKCPIIHCKE